MTAIVGANGTGKSTIVEAMTFALYGEQRAKKESIGFYWAEKPKFRVALEFTLDDHRYSVERTQSDALLRRLHGDDTILAKGLSEVTRACERLTCLTFDQFVNSFCAEQKQLAFLQFRNKAARHEEVSRMLGYHRLEAAETLAKRKRSEANSQIAALGTVLEDTDKLKAGRDEAVRAHKEAAANAAKLEKEVDRLTAELAEAGERGMIAATYLKIAPQLSEKEKDLGRTQASVAEAKARLQALEAENRELQSLQPCEREYRQLSAELRSRQVRLAAEAKIEAARGQIAQLHNERHLCESSIAEIGDPGVQALQARIASLRDDETKAQHLLRESEAEWRTGRESAIDRKSAVSAKLDHACKQRDRTQVMLSEGRCPTCGQPIGETVRDDFDGALRECARLSEELGQLAERCKELENKPAGLLEIETRLATDAKEIGDLQRELEVAQAARGRLDGLLVTKRKLDEQIRTLESEIVEEEGPKVKVGLEELQARLGALEPSHTRFLQLSDAGSRVEQCREDVRTKETQYVFEVASVKRLRLQLQATKLADTSEANRLIGEHERMDRQLFAAKTRLDGANDAASRAERERLAAEDHLARHLESKEHLEKLRRAERSYAAVAQEMRALREKLNSALGPELEAKASENLALLTSGRYTTLSMDRDLVAGVVEDGVQKAVISGGEEDVLALALRLALSELIQERQGRPMALLILDEVFGSLDVDRRSGVLERLASLRDRFDQILVISHIEDIYTVADHCIYLERDPITRASMSSNGPPISGELE